MIRSRVLCLEPSLDFKGYESAISTKLGTYIKFFGCRVWLTDGLRLNHSLHVFANGDQDSFIGATKVLPENKFFDPDGVFVPEVDMLVRVLTARRFKAGGYG